MSGFVPNKSGIWVREITDLNIYIDDGGTIENNFSGHTALILDNVAKIELTTHLKAIINEYGISDLHAKHLKIGEKKRIKGDHYRIIYDKVLRAIIGDVRKANYSYIQTFLAQNSTIAKNASHQIEILSHAFDVLKNPEFVTKYGKLWYYVAFPILEAIKHAPAMPKDWPISVFIDSRSNYIEKMKELTHMSGSLAMMLYSVEEAMVEMINIYIKEILKLDVSVTKIKIIYHKDDVLIDAVDSIAHLGFNHAKCLIQGIENCSPRVRRKYELFRQSFMWQTGMDRSASDTLEAQIVDGFRVEKNRIYPITKGTFFRNEFQTDVRIG